MQIELGVEVQDQVTKLQGVAVARTCWLNGCVRITIQPPVDKDGKDQQTVCVDEIQCTVVGEGVATMLAKAKAAEVAAAVAAVAMPVAEAAAVVAQPAGDRPSATRQADPTR